MKQCPICKGRGHTMYRDISTRCVGCSGRGTVSSARYKELIAWKAREADTYERRRGREDSGYDDGGLQSGW